MRLQTGFAAGVSGGKSILRTGSSYSRKRIRPVQYAIACALFILASGHGQSVQAQKNKFLYQRAIVPGGPGQIASRSMSRCLRRQAHSASFPAPLLTTSKKLQSSPKGDSAI